MFVSIYQLWHHHGRPCGGWLQPELLHLPCNRRTQLLVSLQAAGYEIDVDDWHKHVHHMLPYERYLKRDAKLITLLQQIQLPVYVFTNGDRKHAEICLRLMGINEYFKVLTLLVSWQTMFWYVYLQFIQSTSHLKGF